MSGFAAASFLSGLAVSAAVILFVFAASWVVALVVGRYNVVDTSWGLGFVAVAAASYGWSAGTGADGVRRALVLALAGVWGIRLAGYLGLRSRGRGEDPRYERMLTRARGPRPAYALVAVYLPQAAVAWLVSLPLQAGMYERGAVGPLTWVGGAVWAVGVFFEAVGDAQLAAFKRDPANSGKVMDRGLWHYTRHPNYFGDACVWLGLWLLVASYWVGALTVVSPALMGYLLAARTGKPTLEAGMADSRVGYAEYVRRTSGFLPLPPKRADPAAG